MGLNASRQPGALQEVMLHETAVAWLRRLLDGSEPAEPWLETEAEYCSRLKECCAKANRIYDTEGLCKRLPDRVQLLLDRKGDRLKK